MEKLSKENDELHRRLRSEKHALHNRIYFLEGSRDSWKKKSMERGESSKARATIFDAETDVKFCVLFNISIRQRKQMKTFLRSIGVDLFAKSKEVAEFMENVSVPGIWEYDDVS